MWEITGAEFTNQGVHTADGISIRFPRVTRIRHDKDWSTATSLKELRGLFKKKPDSVDFSHLLRVGSAENVEEEIPRKRPADPDTSPRKLEKKKARKVANSLDEPSTSSKVDDEPPEKSPEKRKRDKHDQEAEDVQPRKKKLKAESKMQARVERDAGANSGSDGVKNRTSRFEFVCIISNYVIISKKIQYFSILLFIFNFIEKF